MSFSQCRGLDVSVRERFWSINKYGRTAAIFKSANCPLLNTLTISFSHLLRDHWSHVFKICLRCSISGLVVSAQKWFRSVDKYGCRQPSLIFTVIASPPKPLEEFFETLHMSFSQCLDASRPKMILVRKQIWLNGSSL